MCESKICLLSWASGQHQPGQAGLLLLAELGIEVIRAKRYEWFSHDAKIVKLTRKSKVFGEDSLELFERPANAIHISLPLYELLPSDLMN